MTALDISNPTQFLRHLQRQAIAAAMAPFKAKSFREAMTRDGSAVWVDYVSEWRSCYSDYHNLDDQVALVDLLCSKGYSASVALGPGIHHLSRSRGKFLSITASNESTLMLSETLCYEKVTIIGATLQITHPGVFFDGSKIHLSRCFLTGRVTIDSDYCVIIGNILKGCELCVFATDFYLHGTLAIHSHLVCQDIEHIDMCNNHLTGGTACLTGHGYIKRVRLQGVKSHEIQIQEPVKRVDVHSLI